MQKFDTPAMISAVAAIPAGRIQFIAADRADTVVEVRPADPAKGRDVRAAEQATVAYADGVLRIQAEEPGHRLLGSSGLDAGTPYGRISNTLKNDGTADLAVHATAAHGDITARSL
ncbi:hypothetical protein QEZ54_22530 [Catellatospora sp. KI3]|uniref:hypothetical protein n=1 Tax=Catellatospora sp. KI3 TaxID=3041620 RepID=UPI0024828E28|nr:hypothetical protein [Catellatospora sp. KI3]MDI1463765.1 hypothetical protein [Catellatospora sp. KI3]